LMKGREDRRAQRELSEHKHVERERERRVDKALKLKSEKARQELESEEGAKLERRRVTPDTRTSRDTTSSHKASRRAEDIPIKDEIVEECKNVAKDYFMKKKNQNDSVRTRVNTALQAQEELNRREEAKLAAQELMELAEVQRKEQQRRRQENQRKELEDNDIDYKSILRDARRAERRELNKALEEHKKLRQQRLKDDSSIDHDMFESTRAARESTWEIETSLRTERALERQRWYEERRRLEREQHEGKIQRGINDQKEEELHKIRTEDWERVYESKADPQNLFLPKAVADETLCHILKDIDDYGSDEDYDLRAAQRRRRIDNEAAPRNREMDKDVRDAKRSVAERALNRARQQRRTIL